MRRSVCVGWFGKEVGYSCNRLCCEGGIGKSARSVAVAIFLECSQQAHENAAGIFGSRRAYRHHNASPQEWIQQRIVRGKRGATRSTLVRRVRKCRLRTWLKQQSLNARRSCATGEDSNTSPSPGTAWKV